MDALELQYDTKEEVPAEALSLYTEVEGKFNLTGINGMKTQTDVTNLQEALRKEREDHKGVQDLFKPWKDLKYDEVRANLDRIPELEAASKGKLDDEAINKIVEGRITQKTGPLEGRIQAITSERDGFEAENLALKASIIRRDMNEAVRVVATEMKVVGTAIPDVELIAANYLEFDTTSGKFIVKADATGVTPGVDIKQFMKEMQKVRPHWWPASGGGGAGGGGQQFGGQSNPWHRDSWNITNQGVVFKEQGAIVADSMAKAAGTTVGGLRPAEKK